MLIRRYLVEILSVAAVVLLPAGMVFAQDYPNKPIRIVTNAPGGDGDFGSRIVGAGISGPLGQPVIVENTGGVVPSIVIMAKAPPDGYTLLYSGTGVWTFPLLQPASFDMERDFAPITQTTNDTYILVVHPGVPVKTVKELIALAKAQPGVLNYSTSAPGGPSHIMAELFNSMAGVKTTRVSYKGIPAAAAGVVSGEVQLTFANAASATALIKAGRMRAIAVTGAEPTPLAPGIPTIAASGLPGYDMSAASGMWAPIKTPSAIINRLNREIVRVLNAADVKEKFFNVGLEVEASTPEQFAAAIRSSMISTAKVIKDANITAN